MLPVDERLRRWNDEAKACAKPVIEAGGTGEDAALREKVARVNALSRELDGCVAAEVARLLAAGKIVGVVGGDHSVPFGAIRTLAERAPLGILHFDAHSDTRRAYEGFEGSHASIMHNVLERIPRVTRIVQVGIRDVCEEEIAYCASQGERVRMFTDRELAMHAHDGEPFVAAARRIVNALPDEVWVSFDIDGLDPRFCPHTGTPVPGGLDVQQVMTILRELVRANRRIVGFDLSEVAPGDDGDPWDGNVGARVLYKLVGFTLASQGRARLF
jgi:agmatinase